MNKKFILLLTLSLAFSISSFSQEESRLLRFPTIHGDQIVFTYAGDLYTVSTKNTLARKLTNHNGFEMFAKFSPDGKQIAFTGQYDGNTEVFVIPAQGGSPKRLTHTATLGRDDITDRMGPNNIVMAWTKDSKEVVYRSRKQSFNSFVGQLFKVKNTGALSEELPLPTGGFCSYSPDGSKLAYNRVFREFRTWKYYKGGMADDVWIYDLKSKKTINITNNDAQDIIPMWHENTVYFISDRDRTMNLFSYNIDTKETNKLTNYTEYDIKFPSIGGDKIVYENAGYIYIFDIKTNSSTKVSVTIADDFKWARNEVKDASKNITASSMSPNGERVVFNARGEIFSVPTKNGITRNLSNTSGSHERNATWSPDGKNIAYISDTNGEFEIYIISQEGSKKPIQLTKNADTYKYHLKWSPDSKKILWSDRKLRLKYVDIESKKVSQIDKIGTGEIFSFNWSPDSKWISYSHNTENQFSIVYLYSLEQKIKYPVTDMWYSSYSPVFSPDGKYLYFISQRDFNPIYSQTEWNHAYRDMSKIYFATLSKETPSPFAPENDEVKIETEKEEKDTDKKDSEDDDKTIKIDIDEISNRIITLPVKASNYWNLAPFDGKIYYNERALKSSKTAMKVFDLKKNKESEIGENMGFDISANQKKMLIAKSKSYYVIDIPGSKISLDKKIDLSDLKVEIDNSEEWAQIYYESWRQMRDFFYVENMHGVDWLKIKDKYGDLLPFVKHHADMIYLIGEMIGELNIGHAYVNGGDRPKPNRIKTGLLGAKLSSHNSGFPKIEKILKGANWSKALISPLTQMGVKASEGDYIIAVNGKSTKDVNDIYELLSNTVGNQVELTINSKPSEKGSWKSIVIPIADEADLYYYNWVQANIEKVDKATNGEVGYLHVPDMSAAGLNEFMKYFYPQLKKKALIIDDRGNGGGNVSPMLIERLKREITRSSMGRNFEVPTQIPRQMMLGPKVLLVNNYSASDGDLFPYSFKKNKLGKVIGVRTWGGVVGIRGSLPFVDGTQLRKPEFASYSAEKSDWIIEGYGVDPDIVVDNDPAKEYAGEDQQLNKAIEVILEELKNNKNSIPPIPQGPDKSK
ncbi:MAG: protease [Bacteroidetes bacterium]|jgi:tricorn protease|nr:protease [Bacteroidota bacterium]MBT6686263.1 protease [Bacteroidota bacterium]MBT7142643.1 protease [Bacteroidota bacterium]MBT7492771.1 protease [Bacteroidota bacterium]